MTWTAFHRRSEVLRAVVTEADRRPDATLPTDVPGVSETFRDELDLVGALQLRWHARLTGAVAAGHPPRKLPHTNPASRTENPPISPTMSAVIATVVVRSGRSNWLVVSRSAPCTM